MGVVCPSSPLLRSVKCLPLVENTAHLCCQARCIQPQYEQGDEGFGVAKIWTQWTLRCESTFGWVFQFE